LSHHRGTNDSSWGHHTCVYRRLLSVDAICLCHVCGRIHMFLFFVRWFCGYNVSRLSLPLASLAPQDSCCEACHVVAAGWPICTVPWVDVPGVVTSIMPRDFGRTRSAGTATTDRGFVLMSQGENEGLLQRDLTSRLIDTTAYSCVSTEPLSCSEGRPTKQNYACHTA
jgi:hypothetical protein